MKTQMKIEVLLLRAQMATAIMLSEIIHHHGLFLSDSLSHEGEGEQPGLLTMTPDPSPSEPIQGNVICLMMR
jgi:hypothetical protein